MKKITTNKEQRMKESGDPLRGLFAGLGKETLPLGVRDGIMARVGERRVKENNRFEWLLFGGCALVVGAGAVVGSRFVDLPALRLPAIRFPEMPVESFRVPPVFLLVAGCAAALLVLDMLLRKRYHKKHPVL